jgi:hypothetical protein
MVLSTRNRTLNEKWLSNKGITSQDKMSRGKAGRAFLQQLG